MGRSVVIAAAILSAWGCSGAGSSITGNDAGAPSEDDRDAGSPTGDGGAGGGIVTDSGATPVDPAHDPSADASGASDASAACAAGTWCRDTTVPAGYTLFGLWGSSSDDLWFAAVDAAGAGAFLHRTTAGWAAPIPIANGVAGRFCGTGPNDVWALGGKGGGGAGTLYHFGGSAWEDRTPPFEAEPELSTMIGCAASSASDVWILDSVGTYHFDGKALPEDPTGGATTGVYTPLTLAVAGGTTFVGGGSVTGAGTIAAFTGSAWSTASVGASATMFSASFAVSSSDVWMSSYNEFAHWNGAAWTTIARTAGNRELSSMWGSGASDIWGVGATTFAHWDGHAWTEQPSGYPATVWFKAVWGDAAGYWAIGNDTFATAGSPSILLHRTP